MDRLIAVADEALKGLTYAQLEELSRDYMKRRRLLRAEHLAVVRRMDELSATAVARQTLDRMSATEREQLKQQLEADEAAAEATAKE